MQKVEAGHDRQQFIEYSFDNLRSVAQNKKIPNIERSRKEFIEHTLHLILTSSSYFEFIDHFSVSAQNIEPEKAKIETSFAQGLSIALKAHETLIKPVTPEIAINIFQALISHSRQTLISFNSISSQTNLRSEFNATIKHPHLYKPELCHILYQQIGDKTFLSESIVKQIILYQNRNPEKFVAERGRIFEEAKKDPNILLCQPSICELRAIVLNTPGGLLEICKKLVRKRVLTNKNLEDKPKRPYHRHPKPEGLSTETKPKRPYHRRIISSAIDKNPTEKTVIQSQTQTTEITPRVKRPYHQRLKTEGLPTEAKPTVVFLDTPKEILMNGYRALSTIEANIRKGRIGRGDLDDLKPIIFRLYELLQPITTRPEKIATPKIPISEYLDKLPTKKSLIGKAIKEIIEEYLKIGHEFLNESTIRFYLETDNFTQKIKEGLVLYDSLSQQFVDRQTPLLKQVISKAIKSQLPNPSARVNVYLNLRERYPDISESTFFRIVTSYIFKDEINRRNLSAELIKASKNQ